MEYAPRIRKRPHGRPRSKVECIKETELEVGRLGGG